MTPHPEHLSKDLTESIRRRELIERIETLTARVARAEAALRWFLQDERFTVAVGGNPNVVEKMLAAARAILAEAPR